MQIATTVMRWYAGAARELPWRRPGVDAWAVLVSEVMLQQTPVRRVVPVYTAWLQRWPTPAALAAAPAGEAVRTWGRLGYPRRALRLHECAVAVVQHHSGRIPAELAELLALPGVGPYTGRAVATFAYGRRHAVVDVNARRVVTRLVRGTNDCAPPSQDQALVAPLVPADPAAAVRFAAGLMELGALVCRARAPLVANARSRPAARGARPATRPQRRREPLSPTPAPTGKPGAGCWPCCGRPRTRCAAQISTQPGRTPVNAPARWPPWSLTGWWSDGPTVISSCPADGSRT